MTISYVGGQAAGRAGIASSTSVTFALTGGTNSVPQAGDLVIITAVVGSQARNPAQAISGYTALGQLNASAVTYDTSLNVSWKFMGATPDTTFTLPSTGNVADAQRYTVQVFRGVDPTTPLDVAVTSATGTATGRPNPASITPANAGAWVVICAGGAAATGAAYTAPANFTTNFLTGATADTNDAMVGSGYWSGWTSGAADPAAYTGGTTGANDSWAAYTIALRKRLVMLLDTTPGSYTLTGSEATLPRRLALPVTPASHILTGSAAALNYRPIPAGTVSGSGAIGTLSIGAAAIGARISNTTLRTLSADPGAYAITGAAAATAVVRVLAVTAGAYTATGSAATFTARRLLTTTPGNYAATGSPATLAAIRRLAAVPGSYALSGSAPTLAALRLLAVVPGAYSINGAAAAITARRLLEGSAGSYAATGSPATIATVRLLAGSAGSYAITGAALTFTAARLLATAPGAYALTGAPVTFADAGFNSGAYALTGSPATFSRARNFPADAGAYTLAGQSATFTAARQLAASPGAHTITGAPATLAPTRVFVADAGALVTAGFAASLQVSRLVNAATGFYAGVGSNAGLFVQRLLDAVGGAYLLTGYDIVEYPVVGLYGISGAEAYLIRVRAAASGGHYTPRPSAQSRPGSDNTTRAATPGSARHEFEDTQRPRSSNTSRA